MTSALTGSGDGPTDEAEALALDALRWLISARGLAFVEACLAAILSADALPLIDPVASIGADIVRAVIAATDEERVRAIVSAGFDAADAATRAAFEKRFPKG